MTSGAQATRASSCSPTRRYCYPLTITDFASRYLLTCDALSTTKEMYAFTIFERTFQDFGLPRAIRTDNGVPFASAHALYVTGIDRTILEAPPGFEPGMEVLQISRGC